MSRTAHLEALYLKMVYAMIEEQKQPRPSETVLSTIAIAKSRIYAEHAQIMAQRGNAPQSMVLQ